MNASRMRRDGRNNFCPEDTPEEYFKRVGRNPSLYVMQCFKQGWDEAAESYEEQHKQSEQRDSVMDNYMIGQRVIYNDVICTVCKPARTDIIELECSPTVWIFDPSVSYERHVSADNIKSLPNGQL